MLGLRLRDYLKFLQIFIAIVFGMHGLPIGWKTV